MKVPVTTLIPIKLYILLRREKIEQSVLVDDKCLDTETIAIKRIWSQVLKKKQFKESKMNCMFEIFRFVQGNRVCLMALSTYLCPVLEVSHMFLQWRTSLRYRSLNKTIKHSINLFEKVQILSIFQQNQELLPLDSFFFLSPSKKI